MIILIIIAALLYILAGLLGASNAIITTKRFEKEDEYMTKMPEQEEAIFFKLGNDCARMPAGKTVIEYKLDELRTPDGKRPQGMSCEDRQYLCKYRLP